MTPDLRAMLFDWLENGTKAQQWHAKVRLALSDDLGPPESDAARAARLIAENPPENAVGRPCGGCPDR